MPAPCRTAPWAREIANFASIIFQYLRSNQVYKQLDLYMSILPFKVQFIGLLVSAKQLPTNIS